MHINLIAKERRLLEEQKNHEEICVQKYNDYANLASDQQLKAIFKNNAQTEQEHLNTIDQLLNGQLPPVNQQGQNNTAQLSQPQQSNNFRMQNNFATNQSIDRNLCSDMLMTENTFPAPMIRPFLNSGIRKSGRLLTIYKKKNNNTEKQF